MTEVLLGVDIGGTTTAAGIVTAEGEVVVEAQAPTHQAGPGTAEQAIVGLIETMVSEAARRRLAVRGIGVGAPGVVDAAAGRIAEHSPHVPELTEYPLAPALSRRFGLPVFLDNDVNALALAEWTFGADRGARSLVLLAPGTGFGAGIVLEGRLVRGAAGFGGELGHAPVKFDGRPCWCGGRGCLAVYASGRGIAEAAREAAARGQAPALLAAAGGDVRAITAALVFDAAEEGDALASAIAGEACRALGAMIAVVVNGLNPEVLVVTGGVAAGFLRWEKRVREAAAGHAFQRALSTTRIRIIPGDKRLSMRGAAALVLYEIDRRGGASR